MRIESLLDRIEQLVAEKIGLANENDELKDRIARLHDKLAIVSRELVDDLPF
jgi:cell division protein FtsB